MPVKKGVNDPVIGATVNQTGSFLMRAEKVGGETLLSQIIHMVAEAQRSRAPIQKLADKVAGYFVPAVILAAIITFIVWAIWRPAPAMAYASGVCIDYCVSLRARTSHADVNHGGGGQRSAKWHSGEERGSDRTHREGQLSPD